MLLYGKAGTGKTTCCLMKAFEYAKRKDGKRAVFVDTENSFSLERIKQIIGEEDLSNIIDNILLLKARNFREQCSVIERLWEIKNRIGLLIVDSFTGPYRNELKEFGGINVLLTKQLASLAEIEKKEGFEVVLTSQVYKMQDGTEECIGGGMLRKWCKKIIKLEEMNGKRIWKDEASREKSMFIIDNSGIVFK